MPMENKALYTLRREHDLARNIASLLFSVVKKLREKKSISLLNLKDLVQAITPVMEAHHRKEMEVFALLTVQEEIAKGNLLDILQEEHKLGYEYFSNALRIIDHENKGSNEKYELVPFHIEEYAKLLDQHIQKEEEGFFPMIKKYIGQDEQAVLLPAFERIEKEFKNGKNASIIREAVKSMR